MVPRRIFPRHFLLLTILSCTFLTLGLLHFTQSVSSRSARLEADLEQHFLQHELVKLDPQKVFHNIQKTGRLSLASSNLSFDLELSPHDLRAQGYRAEEFGPDGVGRTINIGPVRTFRGRAHRSQNGKQLPESGEARFTIDEQKVEGLIITAAEHYFVEPAQKFSKAATTADYVIYRETDVVTSSTSQCGTTLSEEVNQKANNVLKLQAAGIQAPQTNSAISSPTPLVEPTPALRPPLESLQVATEADYEYVLSRGDSARAAQEILSIMNQVEGVYESQLGLTLKISYQSTWNTSNQPYTSINPSALLSELANYWNANRGTVARDVVHMWTGKELENATIGTAYLEALCRFTGNGRAAYGLSKGVSGIQQVAITAHEIGHNLGATHPNQQLPQPAGCDNTIMSSSVSTTPHLDFCTYSANEITNYLAGSVNCLSADSSQLSFTVPKSLPLAPISESAVADFNNDGKEDLVAKQGDGITVLLGSDNGEMVESFNYPSGSSPAVGDFDGDGKPDLVVANQSSGTVTVLRGDGSGVFEAVGDYAVGSPSWIVVSDFNMDGKDDLAALSGTDIRVFINNGLGGFQAPVVYPSGISPQRLFVGQFTGDNAPDLLVDGIRSVGEAVLTVFRNTGTGVFVASPAQTIWVGDSLELRAAVGDLNGDGISDFATAFYTPTGDIGDKTTVRAFVSDGAGGVQLSSQFQVDFRNPTDTVIGDFNGDGWQDIAFSGSSNANGVDVFYGDGTASFGGHGDYNVPAFGKLAVGDFNGDGNQDLIDLSNATVTFGSTAGLQAANKTPYPFPTALAAADFNHDGKQDLVIVSAYDHSFLIDFTPPGARILFGTGTGKFEGLVTAAEFPPSQMNDVTVGDFNNDGRLDIAATILGSDGLQLIMANASGFDAPRHLDAGPQPAAVASGDFTGHGKLDLVVAGSNGTTGEIRLLPGGGDGSFQLPIRIATVGNSPSDLAVADFNSDGNLDIAVAYESSSVVSIVLGTIGGGFQLPFNVTVPSGSRSITVGDFNFDHKLDLAVSGTNVLLGKGDGTFGVPIAFGGGGSQGIVAADFNGDGKTDLAAATALVVLGPVNNANKGSISVLLNTSGNLLTGPANDNFADARMISGANGHLAGTTVLATKQTDEPNHASASNGTGGASIWYRWKAPFTGRFYFQTFSSSFPSVIAVYTGTSVSGLTTVTKSTSNVPEYVEFDATAGTTYRIAIDGVNGDSGRTVLTWNGGSLKNDNFAFAREVRGLSGSVNGDNSNFTLEANEPNLPGPSGTAFSAWYRWTAPNTGKVSFSTTPCEDTTRLLGAYTGNFIDTLNLVAVNFDGYRDFDDPGVCDSRSLRFNATAGTTYRIQLRSVVGKPFTLSWNYANPPPNDNFANALILAGSSGSLVGTNRDATKEPGEPNHAGGPGGASIWYRWTAPSSGPVTFDTIGFRNQTTNSFRYLTALIGVYTGTFVGNLQSVAANATDDKVTFNATAGTTYQIAVDSGPYAGGGYLPGIVPLHWGAKQVANDDFVNAQPVTASGTFVPLLGSNAGATKETGEPNHAGSVGSTSVWYRWTALSTGNVSFVLQPCITCTLAAGNALVGVYTGASVNALTRVPTTADSSHTFTAVRGTTYFIAVDSNTGSGGSYEFSLVSANISARNDAFANAQVLSGSAGAVAGDNSGATKEIVEPNHANDIGGASVWYQWTAPASGLFTFDTFGSNFDTLLAVYTGNVVSALTVVASSDNAGSSPQSRITFDAKLNTTYFIAVDGKSNGVEQGTGLPRSQSGFILLNWNNLPPPVNDNFANAQVLNGASGNATGRNTVASKEGGEPNHAGSPGGVSVWYQWTAPSSGNFSFNTFGSDFNTLLAVYSGSSLAALTPISSNDDVGGVTQSRVTFNAIAGSVYHIAVDGSPGVPGNITPFSGNVALSWAPETGVSNDNFLLAQQLSGSSGSLAATNAGATKENGEPNHAADRGGRSVWYSWTAPFSGPVLFTTAGSDFDTLLAVYTGTSVNQLTPVVSNDDTPYADNLSHILTSSLSFTVTAGTTYRIVVDGSGGRFGNFALRWGPDAQLSGHVSFLGGVCGSDKKVTMLLSGEDTRAVTFTGSGSYAFQHLRVGGNYSVRGVSEISASCLPLFLERAQTAFPLAGDVLDANFMDDGLRGGGSTSNITGHVKDANGVAQYNVAIALSGAASRTVYTDNAGLYLLPNLPAGTYQVTPSKAGVVFTPANRAFTFSSGQTITDADFATEDSYNISGQTRDLNDAALAGVTVTLNNGTQPVSVQTDSNGYYAFDAVAGGSYTLTAAKAGLSFTPVSKTINGLSANEKNVDFTVQQAHTLTVASINPTSAVTITISPNDNNAQGSGTTQFTRSYNLNSNVSLTAPANSGSNVFQKWLKDGADYTTDISTTVTLDLDHTMTAVYLTTTAQTRTGQNISVELNGVTVSYANVTTAGTTRITPISPATAGQLPNGYQLTANSVAFDISTTATVQPPISVCFNVPSITDATLFGQLRLLHNENGTLVDRTTSQDFATRMVCATVNSLSPFVLVSTTVQQLQLLLNESATPPTQAIALDNILLLRDPFPVVNPAYMPTSTDKNTRVMVFVRGLPPGDTAAAVVVHLLVNGQSYDVTGENLFSLPGFDFSQLSFRLPDALPAGTGTIEIRAHGQVSNLGTIRIH